MVPRDDPRPAPGTGPSPTAAAAPVTVGRVPVAETYPLRARVLRPGAPVGSVHLAVDSHPDTAAFAGRTPDGEIVGSAIVYPEACPWAPGHTHAWRLRGMATDERCRDTGVGTAVLDALLDHVRREGGTLVWCNARTPARRFYERAGFTVHGDPWVDPEIGPHVAMARPL